jgi:hypothetical protein
MSRSEEEKEEGREREMERGGGKEGEGKRKEERGKKRERGRGAERGRCGAPCFFFEFFGFFQSLSALYCRRRATGRMKENGGSNARWATVHMLRASILEFSLLTRHPAS